jgi:hypothetical protein
MSRVASRRAAWFVIAFLLSAASVSQKVSQTVSACDPTLQAISGALGYKQRDSMRCEGLYRAPTGGEIELISFARRLPSNASEDKRQIQVEVPPHPGASGKVFIRISTLKEDVYYQLDAVASDGTTFGWPTSEVLDKLGLASKDLGFLGWRDVGKEREFLSLGVREGKFVGSADSSSVITIRSPLPLEWVKWRLYPAEASIEEQSWSSVPGHGFPPGWPVQIRMPTGRSGSYFIDLYALPQNRDTPETLTLRLVF